MDEDELSRKYGHLLRDSEFMKSLLRAIWRDAEKFPRLKRALMEAGVPRRSPQRERLLSHQPTKAQTQADPRTYEERDFLLFRANFLSARRLMK